MAIRGVRSPFDRLRQHYEETELRCPECGFVDEDGSWNATANHGELQYRHVCPRCEAVDTHVLTY